MADHTCLCFLTYGEVHLGPDLRRGQRREGGWYYHCLSCGASEETVFRIQEEYSRAWANGEEVELLKGWLASPESAMPKSVAAQLGLLK